MLETVLMIIVALLVGFIVGQHLDTKYDRKTPLTPNKAATSNKKTYTFSETPLETMTDKEIKKEREFRTGYLNILNYDGTAGSQVDDIG